MSSQPIDTSASDPNSIAQIDKTDLKAVQAAYHDWEASNYDAKFGISYDQRCIDYARDRFLKAVPEGKVEGKVLELGSGTGFFLVNLALAGCLEGELHCSDISPGMLVVCKENAAAHGVDVHTEVGDAEDLPYPDNTFDLVLGHAFIHHLPVPGKAFQEALRVLKPGGRLVIAGEPTYWGDKISTVVKRSTYRVFKTVTSIPGLAKYRKQELRDATDDTATILAQLEHEVDLHTFRPDEVARMADIAGFEDVQVVTEELTANWVGWSIRTIEGSLQPGILGMKWAMGAFRAYVSLTALDEAVFQKFVPDGLFYNLIVSGRKPEA